MSSHPPAAKPPNRRGKQIAQQAVRAYVTIGLSLLALLATALTLIATTISGHVIVAVAGFIYLVLLVAQLSVRAYLAHLEQQEMVLATEDATSELLARANDAAGELQEIRRVTEQELRSEEAQNRRLEMIFTALKDFNLIEIESLDVLSESRPATLFYMQRQITAITGVLGGHWDRKEFLRPEQLWREYRELVGRLKEDETFRSTVSVPSEPGLLFDDSTFNQYVQAIYEAARLHSVVVKRLLVLPGHQWPPDKDKLDHKIVEHIRDLRKHEESIQTLKARLTSNGIASQHFNLHPDFMVWGDGLLIKSNLAGAGELVTQAEFFFASRNQNEEILKRQKQFDDLFAHTQETLPLTAVL